MNTRTRIKMLCHIVDTQSLAVLMLGEALEKLEYDARLQPYKHTTALNNDVVIRTVAALVRSCGRLFGIHKPSRRRASL